MKRILVCFLLLFVLMMAACGNTEPAATEAQTDAEALEEAVPAVVLTIDPHEELVFVGDQTRLSAQGAEEIVWTSSDEKIAAVDSDGVVTALSSGTVTITASLESDASISASTQLRMAEHVKAVELAETELTLLTGSEKAEGTLQVNIIPEDAEIREMKYESSDPAVVEVDEAGVLHAVAPGEATIQVTSQDEACKESAVCTVTVRQGVSAIVLNEESKDLYVKEKLKLSAEVSPEDAEDPSVTWTSSDPAVAEVDENGNVTAVGTGTASIACTANDGSEISAVCEVNVVIGVQRVTFKANTMTLLVGAGEALQTAQIEYTLTPEENSYPELTWTSADESIATVDEKGNVKGVAPGRVAITGATTDPRGAERIKAVCNVTVGNAVQDLKVDWGNETIAKGSSYRAQTTLKPEKVHIPKLAWSTSNDKILTVDANGNIRAVGVGKATITCTTTDGSELSQSKEYTVIQAVTSLAAEERGTIVIFDGNSTSLHVKAAPADATDKRVSWSSADSSVATVDDSGKVTGKNAGKTVISATTKDGSNKVARFNIVVEPSVPITIDSLGFGIYNANLLGITVKNYCTNTVIKNFDFTIALYSYDGSKLTSSGSYSLGSDETIGAGQTRTIKRTLGGVSMAQKIIMTITGVKLSDGSYYSIPLMEQETWTFTRR